MQTNAITRKEYQGNNQTLLAQSPYKCGEWATFLQWRESGLQVKKGERGTHIIKIIEVINPKGKTEKRPRTYVIFNREQVKKA